MIISSAIKATLAVQLNRIAFLLYSTILGCFFWRDRLSLGREGFWPSTMMIGILFCSLIGLFYAFFPARRSRWILAVLVILLSPSFVFIGSIFPSDIITSINGWLLDVIMIFAGTVVPWTLALALFFDNKTEEYFTGQVNSHQKLKTPIRRLSLLILPNACLFIAFSILWIWQYHINSDLSDKIDHVVVPWLWLFLFFAASLLTLQKFSIGTVIKSVALSLVLTFYLFDFIQAILVPIFDPMF